MNAIHLRQRVRHVAIAVVILHLCLGLNRPVAASTMGQAMSCSGSVADAHWVIVDCAPGYATAHDRVRVYRRTGTEAHKTWRENLDQTNAIWIFEAGAQGRASLVIDFHPLDSSLVADLYLDQTGDGQVAYTIRENGDLVVEETSRNLWTFQVVAPDGWWEHEGKTNFNLDIRVDGSVVVTFLADMYLDKIKTDGVVDFIVHVRDADGDGRPDYEWREAFLPFGDGVSYYRTSIMVNTEDDELPISGSIFWPYLGGDYGDIVKPYNTSPPPLETDWLHARISHLGEFVASRANPGNFFVYSFQRLKPGEITAMDHENPFAFYDLAQAHDGYPDLTIRFEHYFSGDRFFLGGAFQQPITEIEYTWDQYHNRSWSYMVGLAGRVPVGSIVQFPEFGIVTVPYDQAASWVTGHSWDAATFVAVEKPPYWSSEHIYTWTVFRTTEADLRNQYVTGLMDSEPAQNYQDIEPGLRGEYNFHLFGQPYLYFSPVDHRLHLLTAQRGIWRLDARRVIRYENLDGGNYLNSWKMFDAEDLLRQLYAVPGFLIYGTAGQVRIKAATYSGELFRTLPPRDHAEWLALGRQLEANRRDFAPGDFDAMVAQFEGLEWRVERAQMRDFRLDGAGFRFVLELQPGFRAEGSIGPNLEGFSAGVYVVTYHGQFEIQPLTPARSEIVPGTLQLSDPAPAALEPLQIEAVLRNTGLEDLPSLRVQLYVQGPGSPPEPVADTEIILLAGQSAPVRFDWTPPAPGEWQISLAWENEEERASPVSVPTSNSLDVQVAAQPPPDVATALRLSNMGRPFLLAVFLTSLGLAAAGLVLVAIRGARSRQ